MLNKKCFFTAFFLASIFCTMLTVAEPRRNKPVNTNPQFESDKLVKTEKKFAPVFIEKEESLKPVRFRFIQFLICHTCKSKEKFAVSLANFNQVQVSIPFW